MLSHQLSHLLTMQTPWEEIQATAQILVVDDDTASLRLLERMLANAGFQHVEAMNDSRAVRTRVEFNEPDLIFLDVKHAGHGWI